MHRERKRKKRRRSFYSNIGVVGRGKFAPSTKRAFPSVYPQREEREKRGMGSKAHGGAHFFGHVALPENYSVLEISQISRNATVNV